jgi:hypothetical protein
VGTSDLRRWLFDRVVLVHRKLEFWSAGASDDSELPVTDFAASCREGLSRGCQPRNGTDGERSGMSPHVPVSAPVLAPEAALGLLPSRALSSAQVRFIVA